MDKDGAAQDIDALLEALNNVSPNQPVWLSNRLVGDAAKRAVEEAGDCHLKPLMEAMEYLGRVAADNESIARHFIESPELRERHDVARLALLHFTEGLTATAIKDKCNCRES